MTVAPVDPASRIAAWQRSAGRHDLPWQHTRDPYRIWLAEIMLQQTQAATVIGYYERFLQRFPDVTRLADAPLDAVLHAWAGLGYYARARNLHRCAQIVHTAHDGCFPRSAAALAALPGIGPSTAAAIAAFAWEERAPILDGNVRRVLTRYYALDLDPRSGAATRNLWTLARQWLQEAPAGLDMRAYTQGQMDLGATVCTRSRPDCARCPLREGCAARAAGRQEELPRPHRTRALPERNCHMLIAECDGRLLLERRAERGIWGGLWSLPQFETHAALLQAAAALSGQAGNALRELPAFDHGFTHFRLHVQPHHLRVAAPLSPCHDARQAWVPIRAREERGMPAPVMRLLARLYESDSGGG